ncbi:unnamed protein product [Gongylonema pulchrum]|uniref:Ovule protein n=1 Tax=Gongylonema pulchrum TaxID=637853 RepID=A0A183DV52_9BILA|nr:unnamed protein product [Gongylonema pulchrum]
MKQLAAPNHLYFLVRVTKLHKDSPSMSFQNAAMLPLPVPIQASLPIQPASPLSQQISTAHILPNDDLELKLH